MKFRLVENIELEEEVLNERTYGMTRRQSKKSLETTLFSDRMLSMIINNAPMEYGFTLNSNNWGVGYQKRTGLPFIFHHMNLNREQLGALDMIFNSCEHNEIHNDIRNLIKNVFVKYASSVLQKPFDTYCKQYKDAENTLKNSDDYYAAVGQKFKAYEDYFRNVKNELYKCCDSSFIGSEIDRLIGVYNHFRGISKTTTDGELRNKTYTNKGDLNI